MATGPTVILQDAQYEASAGGDVASEVYLVSDLTQFIHRQRAFKACTAFGIPARGSVFPYNNDLVCTRVAPQFLDEDKYRVFVTFSVPQFGGAEPSPGSPSIITGGSTSNQTETNRDVSGAPIIIPGFTRTLLIPPPDGVGPPEEIEQFIQEQRPKFSINEAMATVTFTRAEDDFPLIINRKKFFEGTTNGNPVFGDAAQYWYMLSIDFESNDGGHTFRVAYTMQRNPKSWLVTAHAVEPDNPSEYAAGAAPGEGIVEGIQLYPTTDWSLLGLEF